MTSFLIFSKIRAEQEIDKKTWLIEPDEIQSRKGKFNDSFMSKSHLVLNADGLKVILKMLVFDILGAASSSG